VFSKLVFPPLRSLVEDSRHLLIKLVSQPVHISRSERRPIRDDAKSQVTRPRSLAPFDDQPQGTQRPARATCLVISTAMSALLKPLSLVSGHGSRHPTLVVYRAVTGEPEAASETD
jgi:hypothetical protein